MSYTMFPGTPEQQAFWNGWNTQHRTRSLDSFMARQLEVASRWESTYPQPPRVLEIGCGTGWLIGGMRTADGSVGIDLSPQAIEYARSGQGGITFICGDFATAELVGPFDLVVTADAIGHVADHQRFLDRALALLRTNGLLIVMTQNAYVWNRSSYLQPVGHGQIRNWPRLRTLRSMLRPSCRVLEISSIVPGGDRGLLRLANSRYCFGVLKRLLGDRALSLYERLLIGRELVVVARKVR